MTEQDFTISLMKNATKILAVCKKQLKTLSQDYWDRTDWLGDVVKGWFPEMDEWYGFSDNIDLNFYADDEGTMWVTAYPVVNDNIITETFVCIYKTTKKS